MIHTMLDQNKFEYEVIGGVDPLEVLVQKPFDIYNRQIIDLLSMISKKLLCKNTKIKYHSNFVGFGFWARKANIKRLQESRNEFLLRIGRGPTLHIAPSNIPANALYTFAFGLLSGCPSIIRISPKCIDELKDIIELITEISDLEEFRLVHSRYSFITYEHENITSQNFSSKVKARLIWGGDETVNKFRSYQLLPDCIDVIFPDRVSSSIISSRWLAQTEESELKNTAELYGRDIGLFSQLACSSPINLIIFKDCKEYTNEKLLLFLNECDYSLNSREGVSEGQALFNFKSSVDICMNLTKLSCIYKGKNISAFLVPKRNRENLKSYRPENSCLFIHEVISIDEALSILPPKNQTLIHIGIKDAIKDELSLKAAILGSDRIVRPGNALNMDIYWDGYDIVNFLSRVISIE